MKDINYPAYQLTREATLTVKTKNTEEDVIMTPIDNRLITSINSENNR